MDLVKEFHFDSAHFLPNHPGKCRNMHGHTYRGEITISGPVQDTGMVVDFGELQGFIDIVEESFDHKILNDVMVADPTAENIVAEIVYMLNELLPEHITDIKVKLWEGVGGAVIGTSEEYA